MRLVSRVFVFASSLFIIIYGVLPGIFLLRGGFIEAYVAGKDLLAGTNPILFYRFPEFQRLIDISGLSTKILPTIVSTPPALLVESVMAVFPVFISRLLATAASFAAMVILAHAASAIAKSSNRMSYAVLLSSSFALATNFNSSQPLIIMTLMFALSFYAGTLKAERISGITLGLLFPFGAFAAIPAVLFLLSKKWKTFVYFLAASSAVIIVAYLIEGRTVFFFYLQKVFPYYLNGRVGNPFSIDYQTPWSLFRRVFIFDAALNPSPIIASKEAFLIAVSLFKAVVVIPCAYFFYRGITQEDYREALIAASFPVVLLSPTGYVFQFVLLAPAIVALAQTAIEEKRIKSARFFLVVFALACLPVYKLFPNYLPLHNLFLLYEELMLLLILFFSYLAFQSRKLPRRLLPVRALITAAIISAATFTLFLGDRSLARSFSSPVKSVLQPGPASEVAFSPALENDHLTYVTIDSATGQLIPESSALRLNSGANCYGISSDEAGRNFAIDRSDSGRGAVYFKTKMAHLTFIGSRGRISQAGDLGSFEQDGKLYVVDLDPGQISLLDTLNYLPFRVVASCFNSGIDDEIDYILDSLNSSYSIIRYSLTSGILSSRLIKFWPQSFCSENDEVFLARARGDSTEVVTFNRNEFDELLFALPGNIMDMRILQGKLYFSADFERGLNLPTIYEYPLDSDRSPLQIDKGAQP